MTVTALHPYTLGGSEIDRATEIAWAAGLFEGEGSFYGNGYRIRAALSMNDRAIVQRFALAVGCGVLYAGTVRVNGTTHWKWEASTEWEFRRVVDLLGPHLGERRMRRAAELLAEREAYKAAYTTPRECAYCHHHFVPTWRGGGSFRIYCSRSCKAAAYRRRRVGCAA